MPIMPSNPEAYADSRPSRRWRFQFSIRSLLLFTLFAALVLTSVLMYRRMSKAEGELVKLRNETGYLNIEDDALFYAIALDTNESLTWKWRVYLPKGYRRFWKMAINDIPEDGLSNLNYKGIDYGMRNENIEGIVTVSFQRNQENHWKALWKFRTAGTSRDEESFFYPISDQDMAIMLERPGDVSFLGQSGVETRKPEESIIFLKNRVCEEQSPGTWGTSHKPTTGIIVWLEETR